MPTSARRGRTRAAVLLLAACGSAARLRRRPARPWRVSVVASTDVYGSVVTAVGGDAVQVTSLIDDPAADPHGYEATPADAGRCRRRPLSSTTAAATTTSRCKLLESAGERRPVINVVRRCPGSTPTRGDFNEHVWYDLPTMQQLADAARGRRWAPIDPGDASGYRGQRRAFTAQVDALIDEGRGDQGRAHAGAQVAITEPVPGYLIDAAGLVDATPPEFAEAVEEDTDSARRRRRQTPPAVQRRPGRALVDNAQTEDPHHRPRSPGRAQADGVPVVEVTETLPEGVDRLRRSG